MSQLTRRKFIQASGLAIAAPLATPALSQGHKVWRMATSWPKDLQGPGISAQRVADNITRLSNGALTIELFPAGAIAAPLGVLDAVSSNSIEMGHTASAFDGGKSRIAPLFTGLPGGMTPLEHQSWIEASDGQTLWDQLYAPFNVKPFMAGNTGPSMGGWFRTPVRSLTDLKGLKMRMPGLGAHVFSALGVTCVSLPPGETFSALKAGVIDAAEFANPAADMGLGLHQAASHYYGPGLHEPNGVGALYINLSAWQELSSDLQAMVAFVAAHEHTRALAETIHINAEVLKTLIVKHNINVLPWPKDVQEKIMTVSADILHNADIPDIEQRIIQSYRAFQEVTLPWTRISQQQYLQAR